MSNNNQPPFEIGEEVVAIKTGLKLVKGKKYTVARIFPAYCSCNSWHIDVGIPAPVSNFHCSRCDSIGVIPRQQTGFHWFDYTLFRRLAKSFTNALTAALASQVEVGDGVDVIVNPVKEKV